MSKFFPEKDVMCHMTGFTKSCFSCVTEHNCQKWMEVSGKHPQSDEVIHKYGCADSFVPLLLIENSQMQRQTGAAVESFRNEMLELNGSPARRSLAAQ